MTTREILVVGLNPAFQTTLQFEDFKPGKVNRAFRKSHSIGGKGQNFAIACEQLGEADKISILQFVGGVNGIYIENVLSEKGIHMICIPVAKNTRTCTTVLDKRTGEMTELIEPAGRISSEERHRMESLTKDLLNSPTLQGIALCGSLPPGITGSTFTLIAQSKRDDCLLLLDACMDVACLNTGKVDILKINFEEALLISHLNTDADPIYVAKAIINMYDIRIIAITNGPGTSILVEKTTNYKITTFMLPDLLTIINDEEIPISDPDVSNCGSLPEPTCVDSHTFSSSNPKNGRDLLLNPLGAGDTCCGVFFVEYLDTRDAISSFRYGLAAASASCLLIDSTSHFDKKIMQVIFTKIIVHTHIE